MGAAPEMASAPEPWVAVDRAARRVGIRKETLYRWIERRGPPAFRLGRHRKLKLSEVDAWVRAGGAAKDAGEGATDAGKGAARAHGANNQGRRDGARIAAPRRKTEE